VVFRNGNSHCQFVLLRGAVKVFIRQDTGVFFSCNLHPTTLHPGSFTAFNSSHQDLFSGILKNLFCQLTPNN
jgi:hypothetical protein